MSGKLEGFKNDTILFNFQGNKLKFKTADIISVFFNEKDASIEPVKAMITTEINLFSVYLSQYFRDQI